MGVVCHGVVVALLLGGFRLPLGAACLGVGSLVAELALVGNSVKSGNRE